METVPLEIAGGSLKRNREALYIITTTTQKGVVAAVFLVLVFAAYGISNLLLGVSDSIHDPDMESTLTEPPQSSGSPTLRLKMVTMNIAGMEPSQSAPASWDMEKQQDALRREILQSDPDIIALQEAPSMNLPTGMFDHDNQIYRQLHSVPSHAGYVTILVRSDMETSALDIDDVPITAAILTWNDRHIVIASVHLAPFQQGSYERQDQVETLLEAASNSGADTLVFLGDTNMRTSEDAFMENNLELLDAWKRAGSSEVAKFSWDTKVHGQGEESSAWQNRYYGQRTRAYQARYDRVYIKDLRASSLHVLVPVFELMANRPVSESRYHFLSDHFGIATELRLTWS